MRLGPLLFALAPLLFAMPRPAAAQVDHRVDLYGMFEGFTASGHPGHGALVVDWRAEAPERRWATSLSLHSDTLTARAAVRLGDTHVFLEPELRGQTPTAGVLPDYMIGGTRVSALGYRASYVSGGVGVRAEPGAHHTVRATARVRSWSFGALSGTADGLALPTTGVVFEPRASYTWWSVADDPSIDCAARPLRRVRGLALMVELGADVRDDASALVVDGAPGSERWPGETTVVTLRQQLQHGAHLGGRVRWQLGEWAGWGWNEDDLTRARVGGTRSEYFVPLVGAPWVAFLAGRYLAIEPSFRVGVGRDHELGLYADVVGLADVERQGSLALEDAGVVAGVGALADLRWRATQVDIRAGWSPPRDLWQDEPHFTAVLGLGWTSRP